MPEQSQTPKEKVTFNADAEQVRQLTELTDEYHINRSAILRRGLQLAIEEVRMKLKAVPQ